MGDLAKRAFDVLIATAAVVVLGPILLVTGALIWLVIGPPVVFRQLRPGLHGAPFVLYKFRTMRDARGADGEPLPDELRMTRLGACLRRWSLDELPQLFNVIRGDMSLVGPRPLLMEYIPLYTPEQMRRHEVRPGITGWAQVNGRNDLTWDEKFAFDVWYVENRSFLLDLKILLLTAARLVRPRGVSRKGYVTTEKFVGNRNHDRA